MNLFVYTKGAGDITNQLALALNTGETLIALTLQAVTPVSAHPIVLSISSGTANPVLFTVTGGDTGVSYGVPLTVKTNQRQFVVTIAVNVQSDSFDPYPNADPGAYQQLVGSIEAGKTALAVTMMPFPPDFDPSGGYMVWDLLDQDGTIYASGNAFDLKITSSGIANVVTARSLINVPSTIPPTVDVPYQLRYTLTVGQQVFPQFEALTVQTFVQVELGAQDSIEMQGDVATVSLVTERLWPNYVLELRQSGIVIASMTVQNADRVANGYFVAGTIDTSNLPPSCIPYQLAWKFWANPAQTFRESAALWLVTDSMVQAVEDVKSKVNKARTTLYGTSDSQFPSTEIMKWLRRGMDAFNGAGGQFTSFTMTNAMGIVREMWLLYAEKAALDAQYLLEGEKAFQFSGAAINLDVDRTQYLDAMASKIQSQIDADVVNIKRNLIIKGNTGGDGSGPNGDGNFNVVQRGATGAVGITITPATIYSGNLWPYRRL